MKIFKRVLLVVVITLAVIGITAFAGMYYFGGLVIDTALDKMLSSGIEQTTSDSGNSPDKSSTDLTDGPADNSQSSVSPSNSSVPSSAGNNQKNSNVTASGKSNVKDVAPVFSADKIKNIKESITLNDKIVASKLVLSKLSRDEANYLLGLLSGGLTDEEFIEAKQFALSKFSQDDIRMIYDLYKKYTQ